MSQSREKTYDDVRLENRAAEFARQLLERSAAFVGLIALSPVLVVCAVAVKASSRGAILFRQKRVGKNGEIFTLCKFRTMYENSSGLSVTAGNDSRITRIGRILRQSKLDELPELFNILRGEMAFVGPRPEVAEFVDLKNSQWRKVLSVRPGITDPITIEFRNEENLLAQVADKEDFYRRKIQPYKLKGYIRYLEKRNLFYDLKVILLTLKAVVFSQSIPPVRLND